MNPIMFLTGLSVCIFSILFFKIRWSKLNVIDFLFMQLMLRNGIAVILSSFASSETMNAWFGHFEIDTFVLMEAVILCMYSLSIYLAYKVLGNAPSLRIALICESMATLRSKSVVLLLVFVILTTIYGYLHFGILGYLVNFSTGYTVADVYNLAPYWYTSLIQILPTLTQFLTLAFWTRIIYGERDSMTRMFRTLLIGLFVLCLLLDLLYGRRSFLYAIIVVTCAYLVKKGSFLTLRTGFLVLVGVFVMLSISNMYQVYRSTIGDLNIENILSSWGETNKTVSNLNERRPEWALEYMVFDDLIGRGGSPTFGAILRQSIENATPSFVDEDKIYRKSDLILWNFFNVPAVDLPDTPFAIVMGDFGILGGLTVTPLIYLFFILLPVKVVASTFRRFRIFYSILVIGALFFVIDVELDFYTSIMNFWKTISIMLAMFVIVPALLRRSSHRVAGLNLY